MADEVDYNAASASSPWFTQAAGQAANTPPSNSITTERGILTQGVTGISGDLEGQSDDTVTALNAILAAILARPSA